MKLIQTRCLLVWVTIIFSVVVANANAAEQDFSKPLVYRVKEMEDVARTRDIVYKTDGEVKLQMDAYLPRKLKRGATLPAVIFIHGGPVAKDDLPPTEWGLFKNYGELAAASGFVGITFNHRLYGPSDYGRSYTDVKAAIDYVRSHAIELHADPNRIALWFFSAGGRHLSTVLREKPVGLRGIVTFYSMLDLRQFLPPNAAANVVASFEQQSAAAQVKAHSEGLPMFVARAGMDAPQLNQGIDNFISEALAANATLEMMNHPKGLHGFDILNDDARSREIIGAAIQFLQAHLSEN